MNGTMNNTMNDPWGCDGDCNTATSEDRSIVAPILFFLESLSTLIFTASHPTTRSISVSELFSSNDLDTLNSLIKTIERLQSIPHWKLDAPTYPDNYTKKLKRAIDVIENREGGVDSNLLVLSLLYSLVGEVLKDEYPK